MPLTSGSMRLFYSTLNLFKRQLNTSQWGEGSSDVTKVTSRDKMIAWADSNSQNTPTSSRYSSVKTENENVIIFSETPQPYSGNLPRIKQTDYSEKDEIDLS
ncbi:hypothetical protein LOAG_05015 [Loa loa]|uniref:Uncharacterized protein n=1 Tax=Loa loa TaxID=7209 RepID=A0A1S0U0R9_LOALO|nr:hypothetical protein LOAG_05015 [Loa loa]EFO23468.1 hypothetical protein LOAG_05015 [Loa loa]